MTPMLHRLILPALLTTLLPFPGIAQETNATIESGFVNGSVGLEGDGRGMKIEETRSTLVNQGEGSLFPKGETTTPEEAKDLLLNPEGPSANPPRPTARPKPPQKAKVARDKDAPPPYAVSPVANPIPLVSPTHLTQPLGTPAFDAATFASPMGATIVPESWIWERGGWAWSDSERAAKMTDPLLLQAAGSTPAGWVGNGAEGPAGWLPSGPNACEASQRIELALKVHRLAFTPDEKSAWDEAKGTACMRSYVLR